MLTIAYAKFTLLNDLHTFRWNTVYQLTKTQILTLFFQLLLPFRLHDLGNYFFDNINNTKHCCFYIISSLFPSNKNIVRFYPYFNYSHSSQLNHLLTIFICYISQLLLLSSTKVSLV